MNINQIVSKELGLKEWQVKATMELIDSENTVTFIARYRKEVTGNIEAEILFKLVDMVNRLRDLENRKLTVSRQITKYGKMTQDIQNKIESFSTRGALDDYYEQFIPREESEGTKAIALGLQPLANVVKELDDNKYEELIESIMREKKLTRRQCELGVENIIYEEMQFDFGIKEIVRKKSKEKCSMAVRKIKKKNKEEQVDTYDMYEGFTGELHKLKPHNILAILRGIREKQLDMVLEVNDNEIINELRAEKVGDSTGKTASIMTKILGEVYLNVHKKQIASEIKKELTERAEESAINVFAKNLHGLLMQKPLKNTKILGVDPGIRTGTKLALINENGIPMSTGIMKPLSTNKDDIAKVQLVLKQCLNAGVKVFAIGNGTASKEHVNFIANYIKENKLDDVSFVVVSEAGASIYSTSEVAKREFPTLTEYQISAISLARRLQDPLAELVKLDPKTLGVGQYQHDVKGKKLDIELNRVVETCVNKVGVDLNTASPHLLMRVSGLNNKVVAEIVQYRAKNKGFKSRNELLRLDGMSIEIFKQCAGFLRIYNGENKLDSCFIHPENYEIAKKIEKLQEKDFKREAIANIISRENGTNKELVLDIIRELNRPVYDEREEGNVIEPMLRSEVLSVKDLNVGDMFTGIVRSITDFGAFIDIGVHQDALMHISEISDRHIKDIYKELKIGQTVKVQVLKMDESRKKISVTGKINVAL